VQPEIIASNRVDAILDSLMFANLTIIDTTELERLRTIERLVREAIGWDMDEIGSCRVLYCNDGDAAEALRVAVAGGE
jgi:hypothetical protein